MFLASAWRVALGTALVVAAGCQSGEPQSSPATGDSGSSGASTPDGIAFDVPGTLPAPPSQTIDIGITVASTDAEIAVWLEGDYNDASLSANSVTAHGGHAIVSLRTPSAATTFVVGARVQGGPSARLVVSISTRGYGTLSVFPSYANTHRTATSFRASVFVNATCDALAKGAIRDGAPFGDGLASQRISLAKIPAGTPLAVSARAGHYGVGCVNIAAIAPETVTSVQVDLIDVPLALDQTDLEATFTFEPDAADAAAWKRMLGAGRTSAAGAFFAAPASEPKALLDGMRATIGSASDQALFDAARAQNGWDSKVTSWLGARTPSMHDRAVAWMNAVEAAPIGSLVLQMKPGSLPGTALVSLTSFGPLDATNAGLATSGTFDWTADAQDDVHLAGSVRLWGSTLVARAADALAQKDVSTARTVAAAVATQIDCAGLGSALASGGYSYGQCNAACTADACKTAIEARWIAATTTATTDADQTEIKLTASAKVDVGDYAEPLHFAGAWIGQVTAPSGSSGMKGAAVGDKHVLH
jgi:hypothetical protein